mgnify:CR=1 FL=1
MAQRYDAVATPDAWFWHTGNKLLHCVCRAHKGTEVMSTLVKVMLKRIGLAFGAVAFLVGAYLSIAEIYIYEMRSASKAQAEAYAEFVRLCGEYGIDPSGFTGPTQPNAEFSKKRGEYIFEWSMEPSKSISVSITYLPHDVIVSMSPTLLESREGRALKP